MERDVRACLIIQSNDPLGSRLDDSSPWYFDPASRTRTAGCLRKRGSRGARRPSGETGKLFTADLGGEPHLVVARGDDGQLRPFYNVCRHLCARWSPKREGCGNSPVPVSRLDLTGNDGRLKAWSNLKASAISIARKWPCSGKVDTGRIFVFQIWTVATRR